MTSRTVHFPSNKAPQLQMYLSALSSEDFQQRVQNGLADFTAAQMEAVYELLLPDTGIMLGNGSIRWVGSFEVVPWEKQPALVRGLRLVQMLLVAVLPGFRNRRPAWWDGLFGYTAVPNPEYMTKLVEHLQLAGLTREQSLITLSHLIPEFLQTPTKYGMRAPKPPFIGHIQVTYHYELRKPVTGGKSAHDVMYDLSALSRGPVS